jgi:nitrate reductase gamma subunit
MFTELVDGILWDIAVVVFVAGIVWRLIMMLRHGTRKELAEPRGSATGGAISTLFSRFVPRREMASKINLHVIAGYLFHIGLFALLLFAAPHIEFAKEHVLGFGWPAMPYWAFIVSAQLAFLGLIILWLHRVLHPVTKLLSRADDHIGAMLVFVVMLTGCMALFESYTGLRVLHRFTVELFMIYFPFSSLMHAIMFISSRGYTGALFGTRGVKA